MGRKSKFKLSNGKSTGYALAYFLTDEGWHIIRGLTKDNAKLAMEDAKKCTDVVDIAILHVEDTWQRRFFGDEAF